MVPCIDTARVHPLNWSVGDAQTSLYVGPSAEYHSQIEETAGLATQSLANRQGFHTFTVLRVTHIGPTPI